MVHLIPIGEWEHDSYGTINLTPADIQQFKTNFDAKVRNGVAITAGHEGYAELPAQGWITRVECRESGLWGEVDWNELGKKTLSDKQFKFFSPEFFRQYEDPESHETFSNVLTGGALTKSPYFKELAPIVFSEKGIKKFNDNSIMDIATITAKKVEELNDEEKAFLVAHKDELTEDQKTAFTSVIDVAPAETEEAKTAREAQEKIDANRAAGLNDDGSAKTAEVQAAEKKGQVMISASELEMLRGKADKGDQAFKELRTNRLNTEVTGMIFNENSNKAGKFLPKSKESLHAFMDGLNDNQLASFKAIVASLPEIGSGKFNEIGSGAAADATPFAEIERRIAVKQTANPKLTYSEGLKAVMSEAAAAGEQIEQRYDSNLPKAKKDEAVKA